MATPASVITTNAFKVSIEGIDEFFIQGFTPVVPKQSTFVLSRGMNELPVNFVGNITLEDLSFKFAIDVATLKVLLDKKEARQKFTTVFRFLSENGEPSDGFEYGGCILKEVNPSEMSKAGSDEVDYLEVEVIMVADDFKQI